MHGCDWKCIVQVRSREHTICDGSNWYAYCNSDPVNYVDMWGLTASDKGGNDESNTFGKLLEDLGSFAKDILGIAAIGMGKALEWSAPFLGGLAAIGANYGTGGAALAYSSSIVAAVTVATKSLGAALAKQGQALFAQGNIWDDYEDDDYTTNERIGKNNGKTPRNNQAQNEQINDIAKKHGLTNDERRQLHDILPNKAMVIQKLINL